MSAGARKITLGDRLRYRFDNTMSRGPIALIGWLALLSVLLVLSMSALVAITEIAPAGEDEQRPGFLTLLWMSFMHSLDAGTVAGDNGSRSFLLAMLAVTVGGIFIVSSLIGVLTSALQSKLEDMRKGRSFVVEHDHTLILGWSPQVFPIVQELAIANQNRKNAVIVILGDEDKVAMEDAIRGKAGDLGRTRVVCRSGSAIDLDDLEIVNPNGARAIIVLGPGGADPDAHVIKTILALTNGKNRRKEPYHIVAEIRDPRSVEPARMVGRREVQIVLASDLISRITVQTCRQSGLSVVYTELLDFGGDEIYFQEEPRLAGKTFGEALSAYEDSAVIGLRTGDGEVRLNPPMDTVIAAGDQVIAVSEDDDTIRLSDRGAVAVDEDALREAKPAAPRPERTLILGWNRRASTILNELDHYVAPGSEVLVVADVDGLGLAEERRSPAPEATLARECAGLQNLTVRFEQGDATDRRTLERLEVASYEHVITLSYSDLLGPQEADALTLLTLLHLRDIEEKAGESFSIVSEMLDARNQKLAEVTRADDFIVSDKLVSLALSQISENKHLSVVFEDLFDADGAELYLKPAGDYVEIGKPVSFYTVLEAARRRGEVALGYRIAARMSSPEQAYGVEVNPKKSDRVAFADGDRVIVLAES
jgi:voltage-gated potassium channel Kch